MKAGKSRIVAVSLCLALMVTLTTVWAQEGYGLINNGGFEDGFYPWGPNDSLVANGWTPFVITDPNAPPQYMDTAAYGGFAERLDGQRCQKIWANWVPFDAGLYQQVQVTPGDILTASVEWAAFESRDSSTNQKNEGEFIGRSIGIDPSGGTDPLSPNVAWSTTVWSQSRAPKNDQGELLLKVEAVAQAETITVFLRAQNPQSHGQDQVFFDVVRMTSVPGTPPPPPDADGDGVPDEADQCPGEPGPAENNGCPLPTDTPPPPDADGDGVADEVDQCPNESGPAENNGCPLPPDSDGDGLSDEVDQCPNESGPAENNGCPLPTDTPVPLDSDGDGVSDEADQCPNESGPVENNGCPWPTATPIAVSTPEIVPTPTPLGTPTPTRTPRPRPTPTPAPLLASLLDDVPPSVPRLFLCISAIAFIAAGIALGLFVWVWRQKPADLYIER